MSLHHVVFGAGQVGTTLAEHLALRGERVRLVTRSSREAIAGVEVLRADAMDPAAAASAAAGASAIYHCMNPAYSVDAWRTALPVLQRNLVTAAGRAGARIVVLENLYPLGDLGGRPATESTPVSPCSAKGRIRAELFDGWMAAHARGDAAVVVGRGSDFFGPRGTQTMFEGRFWTRVLAGRSAQLLVPPDLPHTYHYIPDVAAGLATLGTASDVLGRQWMLPCAPAVTTRELIVLIGRALGRDVAVSVMPRPVVSVARLFVPILRELDEMRYQWAVPFVVDDGQFQARFAQPATPLETAARETVDWARKTFST